MKREWIHPFVCLLGGTILAGCDADRPSSSPPIAVHETSGVSRSADPLGPAAGTHAQSINLQVGDVQTLGQMIQARRGRVVLIDYWATWCTGCVAMFPHTVALHHQYQPQGLSAISVSFDEPGQADEVRAFLHRQRAGFDHLISRYAGNESFERFKATVGIPLYRLYDRQGRLRYEFSPAAAEYPHMEPPENMELRIRELLQEGSDASG